MASVHQIFTGAVAGDALLMIDRQSAAILKELLTNEPAMPLDIDTSAREVLTEIGNILLNACLGTFGNLLHVQVSFSVPHLTLESLEGVVGSITVNREGLRYALIVHAAFRLKNSSLTGYLVIVLERRLDRAPDPGNRTMGARSKVAMEPELSIDASRLPAALVRWFSELTHEGIFATDREFRVIVWNRWMEIHTDRPATSVIGVSIFDLYPDLVDRGVDRYYREALAGRIAVMSFGLHKYVLPLAPTHPELGYAEMPQSGRIGPLSDGDHGDRHSDGARGHLRSPGARSGAAPADRSAADGARDGRKGACAPRTNSCRPFRMKCGTRSTRCSAGHAS